MSVITFSRYFPAKHPRKGEPTYFVEKIWKCLWDLEKSSHNPLAGYWERYDQAFPCTDDRNENIHKHTPKAHTIRAGNRWKVGDTFSPRVWSGQPYRSKQIQFAPDIEIKKIWEIKIRRNWIHINGKLFSDFEFTNQIVSLAQNDGLEIKDFWNWFDIHPKMKNEGFSGQILCWNENINY